MAAKFKALSAARLAQQSKVLEQAFLKTDLLIKELTEEMSPHAIEALLSQAQKIAKNPARPGAWKDRTGNLRDSIMVVILKPRESRTADYHHGTTTAQNDSEESIGIIYAGMEYGLSVEFRPGYSVLGWAVESIKERMSTDLANMLKFSRHVIKDYLK